MNSKLLRVSVLLFFVFSAPRIWSAEKKRLTILHTNDTHSTLFPYGPLDSWGGIAWASRLIKELKAERPNVLALNSGHAFLLANGLEPGAEMQTGLFEYNVVRDYMSGRRILNFGIEGRIVDRSPSLQLLPASQEGGEGLPDGTGSRRSRLQLESGKVH